MKDDSTYGLSPQQLARLLAIGLQDPDRASRAHVTGTPADMLRDMLTDDLSLDPTVSDSFPAVLNRPCDEMLASAGRPLVYVLLNRTTDLTVLKTLKDYAKELVSRGDSEAEKSAATAIYYAAIASALVFHQHKISHHSYEGLDKAFTKLERKPWVWPELKDLFQKAQAFCRQCKKVTG